MVSISHPNAKFYFERDVKCIQRYFEKNYGLTFEGIPELDVDVDRKVDLDKEIKASGFLNEQLGKDIGNVAKLFDQVAEAHFEDKDEIDQEEAEDEDTDSEDQGDQ